MTSPKVAAGLENPGPPIHQFAHQSMLGKGHFGSARTFGKDHRQMARDHGVVESARKRQNWGVPSTFAHFEVHSPFLVSATVQGKAGRENSVAQLACGR